LKLEKRNSKIAAKFDFRISSFDFRISPRSRARAGDFRAWVVLPEQRQFGGKSDIMSDSALPIHLEKQALEPRTHQLQAKLQGLEQTERIPQRLQQPDKKSLR